VVNQESVGWVDYDKDGDLDLSVASELLRNDGGSSFSQVTGQPLTGLNYVKAMAWTDYDRDGDSDVFFGRYHPGFPNDDSNKLIRNNGNGTFTDVTPTSLLMPEGCTGAAWGDYDNDGDPDLVATGYINDSESDPYTPQVSRLFRYDGGTTFTNIVDDDITRLEAASIEWGDYDNDGRLDLYGAGPLTNFLLRNDGGSGQSSFSNKSADPVWNSAFGLAAGWADYDLDGDIDLYLANLPSEDNPQSLNPKVEKGCRLFRNENSNGNTWLHVYLVGDQNNHDGVGARLKLLADTGTFYRQSDGGGGHGTQNSKLIEFGLGAATSVSALKVTWPNGEQTILGPIEELNTVIVAYEPTPPPPPGPMSVNLPISTRLLGGRPNPFRAATSIQFSLSGEAMPDLEVYDVAGRKIRSAGLGLLPAGVHEWNWDGRNNEGQRVSSGVYYARFRVGGVSESARLLLLR